MKRFKSTLLSFIFLLFLASSVVAQNGPVGGSGAEPIAAGGGITINDVIEFPVKLAEDVAANDPAYVTGYTYDGENVLIAPDCAKPETTFAPLFAWVSHDGSRLFQVYKTTLGLPYAIWNEVGLGHTTLGSHTASTNSTAYASYGGISSSRDNSTVAIARYNSPYVLVYKWDSEAEQYVQLASPFATAPGQQHFNSIAVNCDGSKMVLRGLASPYFVSYTWDSGTGKYVKDTDSLDALNADARACTFIGNSNDIILGCVGYLNDGLVKYTWDSENSRYVKAEVLPGIPATSIISHVSASVDGSKVVARNNNGGSGAYETYFFYWDENISGYVKGNDLDIDGTTADAQVFISGNGQFVISSAGPNKVYVYKWSDVNQRFERVAVLPENTINSKPENISISDSGAQIVFPHYQTIYCYNYNLVGNGMQGYRLATHNLSALPSAANFTGIFNKAGAAGSIVPFTAIWHKFVPTF